MLSVFRKHVSAFDMEIESFQSGNCKMSWIYKIRIKNFQVLNDFSAVVINIINDYCCK